MKIERKLKKKKKLTYYNLMIVQDLWQAPYQILSINFLKKLIELNVNTDTVIKKCETFRIKYKYHNCWIHTL